MSVDDFIRRLRMYNTYDDDATKREIEGAPARDYDTYLTLPEIRRYEQEVQHAHRQDFIQWLRTQRRGMINPKRAYMNYRKPPKDRPYDSRKPFAREYLGLQADHLIKTLGTVHREELIARLTEI